jgi:VWFA-related protein
VNRRGVWVPVVLALAVAAPAGAELAFRNPSGREPVFGPVEIAVDASGGEPLTEVALFVDGSLVARLSKPPYRARFDVGQGNAEHHFVAQGKTLFGTSLRAELSTPAIEVGEQVDVELVHLYMNVQLWDGRRPEQLTSGDFVVADEGGTRAPVSSLSRGDVPLSGVVLVDSSDSMRGEAIVQALAAVQTVPALLGAEDEVLIALFSDRLLRATEFTRRADVLAGALGGVEAAGGSAILDHLYFALNRLRSRLGRPVVILFSDGEDVSSVLGADEIRWRVRRSQATLYWIRLQPEGAGPRLFSTFWRDVGETKRQFEVLEETVRESGGEVLPIQSIPQARSALVGIFERLRAQVVLGFYPVNRRHDGNWRPIRVSPVGGGMQITARAGYVDE